LLEGTGAGAFFRQRRSLVPGGNSCFGCDRALDTGGRSGGRGVGHAAATSGQQDCGAAGEQGASVKIRSKSDDFFHLEFSSQKGESEPLSAGKFQSSMDLGKYFPRVSIV
jgi:hypothetical protein